MVRQRSVLANLPRFEWDDRSAVRFEVTLDLIGQVMAVYTARRAVEKGRADPDLEAVRRWDAEVDRAAAEQRDLRSSDPEAVERTRARYAELLRALRAGPA